MDETTKLLIALGLNKEIYNLIKQWGQSNGLVFKDIDFTVKAEEPSSQVGAKSQSLSAIQPREPVYRQVPWMRRSQEAPTVQASSDEDTQDQENSAEPEASVLTPATQVAQTAAAKDDDEPTEQELREYNKTIYPPENSLEDIKRRAQEDYENVKKIYNSLREYIIEQIKVYASTNESKYIRPRQVKSFIRHPSLIGFMR